MRTAAFVIVLSVFIFYVISRWKNFILLHLTVDFSLLPTSLKMAAPTGLSPSDPSSYSRPEQWKTTNIDINWNIDFDKQIVYGFVDLTFSKEEKGNFNHLYLDTRDLNIKRVSDLGNGSELEFLIEEAVKTFGSKLDITVPADKENLTIRIVYETTPKSTALQWLKPQQTSGKQYPYLFSQCQAIHARSMLPCQDTPAVKAPFTATVKAPKDLVVLMGAIKSEDIKKEAEGVFSFQQPIPIPSYLIAIAVGALKFRKISSRIGVWSEKEFVDKAAEEFSEAEQMLKIGEELMGAYVWGRYDILVLPPSFPFGGMENPCLTFVTPTILAGDKSLADVVAHEISHSWTGNLVTNRNFEHFWLNEGFTVFMERKIIGRMFGEAYRHLRALLGWKELIDSIQTQGADNPLTNLVVDLRNVDPDDAFSTVPYEKGHTFLFYLEELIGGPEKFEPFLKLYIEKYQRKSLDTEVWKDFFLKYFQDKVSSSVLSSIDWNAWLNTPGMPPIKPKFDGSLGDKCTALREQWIEASDLSKFSQKDISTMSSLQICHFLGQFMLLDPLPIEKFEKMTSVYALNETGNSEIKFLWIRLGIRSRYMDIVEPALKFVSEQGRMKYVRPIFRDLYKWDEIRPRAIETYNKIKPGMMYVTSAMVAKDLHLKIHDEIM